MTLRPHLAIAAAALLCAPAGALASGNAVHERSASVNCGGSGVNSLYCIPQQSVFTFTHVSKGPRCSLQASFTVEPKIEGLHGRVHLEIKGVSHQDRGIDRVARQPVTGGSFTHTFKKLRSGSYSLSGWYEGDSTRQASAHRSTHATLRCG